MPVTPFLVILPAFFVTLQALLDMLLSLVPFTFFVVFHAGFWPGQATTAADKAAVCRN